MTLRGVFTTEGDLIERDRTGQAVEDDGKTRAEHSWARRGLRWGRQQKKHRTMGRGEVAHRKAVGHPRARTR